MSVFISVKLYDGREFAFAHGYRGLIGSHGAEYVLAAGLLAECLMIVVLCALCVLVVLKLMMKMMMMMVLLLLL